MGRAHRKVLADGTARPPRSPNRSRAARAAGAAVANYAALNPMASINELRPHARTVSQRAHVSWSTMDQTERPALLSIRKPLTKWERSGRSAAMLVWRALEQGQCRQGAAVRADAWLWAGVHPPRDVNSRPFSR